jgi:hypothetical protein
MRRGDNLEECHCVCTIPGRKRVLVQWREAAPVGKTHLYECRLIVLMQRLNKFENLKNRDLKNAGNWRASQ